MKANEFLDEITVGGEPAEDTNLINACSKLPFTASHKGYDIFSDEDTDNGSALFCIKEDDIPVAFLYLQFNKNYGLWQATRSWASSRGTGLSGILIEYSVKVAGYTPLLSDDVMSPPAIGLWHKMLKGSNSLELWIWDTEEKIKIPYDENHSVYSDIHNKLRNDIPNTQNVMQGDGDRYIWLIESWNPNRGDIIRRVSEKFGGGVLPRLQTPFLGGKTMLKERHGYIAFEVDEQSRNNLLKVFPPKYPEVIGHHITHQFGVPEETELPSDMKDVKVVGYADDGTSLEALVVAVNGNTQRPDGRTYHITWSLDREQGRKPVHSNNLIKEQGYEKISPIQITAIPKFF